MPIASPPLSNPADSSLTLPPVSAATLEAAVLTGGFDRPYAFGLSMALIAQGISLDVIGSTEVDSPEMHATPKLEFRNLYGDPRQAAGIAGKLWRVLLFYIRLFRYAASAKPEIFHILWNNKFPFFDRTALMVYYKLLGKKIVFTAHNVNAGKRDSNDSFLNRLTLKIQYHLADHIFVHTEKMKSELSTEFGVRETAITVIPFGINNSVPHTLLTRAQARERLGLHPRDKTILFYGAIRPYKGLEYLVEAFHRIAPEDKNYRLIIAGEPKKDFHAQLDNMRKAIAETAAPARIIERLEFIPDEETEVYFKAADVLVLPYTLVFQSGVLFLAYSFGLPVIASDVGNFREDILEGRTGFLCQPCDAASLAETLETYFHSDLFHSLDTRRQEIKDHAAARHSWDVVGQMTRKVYEELTA